MKGNIRVIIRMRPLLKNEKQSTHVSGKVEVRDEMTVSVNTAATGTKSFEFFRAFNETASQGDVFDEVKPLIQSALDGFNVCFIAYGKPNSIANRIPRRPNWHWQDVYNLWR